MNRQEQEIIKLNSEVKANLGVSRIHGIGVVAIRSIAKGDKLYADRMPNIYQIPYGSISKLFPEVRKIILERWPSIVNGSKFIYPDARLVSFMNHGGGEQANYDPETDTALRDLSAGEEILEENTKMPNWENIWTINKNQWLSATNAEKSKSLRNTLVALLA